MDGADAEYMRAALAQAAEAKRRGEVPVGAIVVLDDTVVGEGFNQPIGAHDPTAHAEIVAMRAAAKRLGNYRLTGATLYVTIEPCQMCVGAMVHARIARLVYGTPEPKAGAIESAMRAHEHPALNHRIEVLGGVLEAECRALIQGFFEGAAGTVAASFQLVGGSKRGGQARARGESRGGGQLTAPSRERSEASLSARAEGTAAK